MNEFCILCGRVWNLREFFGQNSYEYFDEFFALNAYDQRGQCIS